MLRLLVEVVIWSQQYRKGGSSSRAAYRSYSLLSPAARHSSQYHPGTAHIVKHIVIQLSPICLHLHPKTVYVFVDLLDFAPLHTISGGGGGTQLGASLSPARLAAAAGIMGH